jgi:hypothetical protein
VVDIFKIVIANNEEDAIKIMIDYIREKDLGYHIWDSNVSVVKLDEAEIICSKGI